MADVIVVSDVEGKTVGDFVQRGIEKAGHTCKCYYSRTNPTGFHNPNGVFGLDNVPSSDMLIIFGTPAFAELMKHGMPGTDDVRVVLTDSHYRVSAKAVNLACKGSGFHVYAMPDLFMYRERYATLPYYHPMEIGFTGQKDKGITVCHSPSRFEKMALKGTEQICKKVRTFPVRFQLVLYKMWEECLQIKAGSHIFIDQLINDKDHYIGGVGKSGLEAMALQCLTMTSGIPFESDCFPSPPVVWLKDYNDLGEKLKYYLDNPVERKKATSLQHLWAKQYLSLEFVGKHLTQEL